MTALDDASRLEAELAAAREALAHAQTGVRMRDLHIEGLEAELRRMGRLVSDLRVHGSA